MRVLGPLQYGNKLTSHVDGYAWIMDIVDGMEQFLVTNRGVIDNRIVYLARYGLRGYAACSFRA